MGDPFELLPTTLSDRFKRLTQDDLDAFYHEAMKPQPIVWKDEPGLARRKLIVEAARCGEEMHEARHE